MTLIDVLVGSALTLVVFVALLGLLRASLLMASSAKAKAGATAIATTQMEYLRSLPYDELGTVGGIPAGAVSQTATTTENSVLYTIRTLVTYVDDERDGVGASDENGITTDYKRAKVAVSYTFRQSTREVALVSNMAPPSLETTTGGGTLRVNIVGAGGAPVPGASIRIENPSLVPAVDVTVFSDTSGSAAFPGAPTSTDYRVSVTKSGYSSAETYARDATNQNPTPGYLTIAQNQTTTGTFAIDLLAPVTLRTLYPVRAASFADSFLSSAYLVQQTNTQVSGGSLALAGVPGAYALSGSARSTTTAPAYLSAWKTIDATRSMPAGTTLTVRVADGSGALLPDSVLPGNSAGFSAFPVSLAGIATTTYPALSLLASLSGDGLSTPELSDWTLSYDEGPIPVPNVSFTLTGDKKKGTTGAGLPIYKTVLATSTNASGIWNALLEWDVYTLSGLTLASTSTSSPYTLSPGVPFIVDLFLTP